jgi:hypothetical protein
MPKNDGYHGPFDSHEEELAARQESRGYAAAYNEVSDEKLPGADEADPAQSAEKPPTGEIEDGPARMWRSRLALCTA